MLDHALGTEILIERCLEIVENVEDEVADWPIDTLPNRKLIKGLSHSKMINEINHKEPRGFDKIGNIVPMPVFWSRTGCHCGKKSWRRGDLDQLGIGINLYFRMLKYLGFFFLIFALVSIPSM